MRAVFLDACRRAAAMITPHACPDISPEGLIALMPGVTDVDNGAKLEGVAIFRDAQARAQSGKEAGAA